MLRAIDGRWFHRYPILAAHAIWTILTEIQVSGSPGKNLPGIEIKTGIDILLRVLELHSGGETHSGFKAGEYIEQLQTPSATIDPMVLLARAVVLQVHLQRAIDVVRRKLLAIIGQWQRKTDLL